MEEYSLVVDKTNLATLNESHDKIAVEKDQDQVQCNQMIYIYLFYPSHDVCCSWASLHLLAHVLRYTTVK